MDWQSSFPVDKQSSPIGCNRHNPVIKAVSFESLKILNPVNGNSRTDFFNSLNQLSINFKHCQNFSILPSSSSGLHKITSDCLQISSIRSFSLSKPHAEIMSNRVGALVQGFNKRNMSIFEKFIKHFRRYTLVGQ